MQSVGLSTEFSDVSFVGGGGHTLKGGEEGKRKPSEHTHFTNLSRIRQKTENIHRR